MNNRAGMEEEVPAYLISCLLIICAFLGLCAVIVVSYLWPQVIPFKIFDLWIPKGKWYSWLLIVGIVSGYGVFTRVLETIFNFDKRSVSEFSEEVPPIEYLLFHLIKQSVLEEILFRWIFFLSAILIVKLLNFLLFGWLGFGLVEWLQIHLLGPLANFITFGWFKGVFTISANWAIGIAILLTNLLFAYPHKLNANSPLAAKLSVINAWIGGMFCFWILLEYGLLIAILAHFVHSAVVTIWQIYLTPRRYSMSGSG